MRMVWPMHFQTLSTILNSKLKKTMERDVNQMVQLIKYHGYIVVPEWMPYKKMWEIVILPWDFANCKRRPGRAKRTGEFFNKTDCSCSNNRETKFAKKMKEVQNKLCDHFEKKKEKV